MQRNSYTKKYEGSYSTQNEPLYQMNNKENFYYEYPDMKKAYDKFKFFTKNDNFILTSGTETSIRITLQTFKPKMFSIEHPSWGMPEIISYSLDIPFNKYNYRIKNNKIIPENPTGDLIYYTDKQNNLFAHEDLITDTIKILDCCYTMNLESMILESKKNFVVGSFSKIEGPGLRLGFLLYPEKYHNKIQLLREQYINTIAYNYLISLKEWPRFPNNKNFKGNPLWFHDTYATYNYLPKNISKNINEYKIFSLDGQTFYRLGNKRKQNKQS